MFSLIDFGVFSFIFFLFVLLVFNISVIPIIKEYKSIKSDFYNTFSIDTDHYYDNDEWLLWLNKHPSISFKFIKLKFLLSKSKRLVINDHIKLLERKYLDEFNDHYIKRKLFEYKDYFNKIEKFPFDQNQREAILSNEVNNLVIAGAGTGKTATLVGKVAYLIQKLNIPPERILLLAFTKKAVEEMEERIEGLLGIKTNIRTFHSLGYEIISKVNNEKKDIAFTDDNKNELYDLIQKIIENNLINNKAFTENVYKFFKYHINNNKPLVVQGNLITKNGEKVKSYQELVIANFLAVNNIKYIYEYPYEFHTATVEFRQYQPDFYLLDYKIYIEHFAVNRKNEPPSDWSKEDRVKYLEGMRWKRDTHIKNNTKLLETYSWEFDEDNFTELFKAKLRSCHVEIDDNYSIESIYQMAGDKKLFYMIFTDLLIKFLTLFKSNNYTLQKLFDNKNRISPVKAACFISCFEKVYTEYQSYLNSTNKIDFADMIRLSTDAINAHLCDYHFDYILVDEFQDISYGRYELLKAFRKQNPKLKLFCVGDDWQSIFRFTGSDINLFFSFEEYFGHTKRSQITQTFRFGQELATLSENFIMKNTGQIKKTINTEKRLDSKPFKIYYYDRDVYKVLTEIIDSIVTQSSKIDIMFLGRYNLTFENYRSTILSLKHKYKECANIEMLTVHKSKGKQADHIILLDLIDDLYGFPSKVLDDDVLNLVLLNHEQIPFAEERRLFYVAMTRTKNKFFILNKRGNISPFLVEIVKLQNENETNECPDCNGILKEINGSYGKFLGCENFPACKYKKSISAEHQNQYNY